jgi:hypothetical protein
VDDNSGLCKTKSCRKKSSHVPLIASISAIIVVILLISLGFWIFKRHKGILIMISRFLLFSTSFIFYFHSCISFITTTVTSTNSKKRGSLESKHQAFNYTEILNITDNFKTIIGEGGFGKVYFGTLQDQTQVAVKRLSPSSVQGYKEFQSEVRHCIQIKTNNIFNFDFS